MTADKIIDLHSREAYEPMNNTDNISKQQSFQPARALKHRHIQTIFPTLFRSQVQPEIVIEQFELDDGDFIECYWHKAFFNTLKDSKRPIVVLFHGLAGSFASSYIQGMMNSLQQAGYSSVLMHFRGSSGKMNRLPRSYHSGDTADAKAWLASLQQRFPENPLCAIGYSLGGNMLLKLLGEGMQSMPLQAAVSVSAPIQLDSCSRQMNQGFSRFYQYILLKELKRNLLQKYKVFDMAALTGINEAQVRQLSSFYAFDDVYTGPIHGFSSADDYYQQCSARQYLPAITTPTLIIHALDDPFMPPDILPDKKAIAACIQLEVSRHGGHLGFISGHVFKPQYWLEQRIIRYFQQFNNTINSDTNVNK